MHFFEKCSEGRPNVLVKAAERNDFEANVGIIPIAPRAAGRGALASKDASASRLLSRLVDRADGAGHAASSSASSGSSELSSALPYCCPQSPTWTRVPSFSAA